MKKVLYGDSDVRLRRLLVAVAPIFFSIPAVYRHRHPLRYAGKIRNPSNSLSSKRILSMISLSRNAYIACIFPWYCFSPARRRKWTVWRRRIVERGWGELSFGWSWGHCGFEWRQSFPSRLVSSDAFRLVWIFCFGRQSSRPIDISTIAGGEQSSYSF